MVPEHWDIGKIRYFSEVLTGGTPNRNHSEYWDCGTIPWMSSGEVNYRIVTDTLEKITPFAMKNSNAKLLPINSVMIALNGQGKTKGMAAILKIPATCNQSLAAIVCDSEKIHYYYMLFYLESRYKEIRGLVGEMRDGLNLDIIRSLPIYKPPLPEQYAITEFLDREITVIDHLGKMIKGSIDKLQEYRSALVSAAVTGKIDVRQEAKA
jgi:type I restriction enzyme S subunit